MLLPGAEMSHVSVEKLRDYLLNEDHPVGGPKARLLKRFGFDRSNLQDLVKSLEQIPQENPVVTLSKTPFGTNFRVDGHLLTPSGRSFKVATIWTIEQSGTAPRFVTLYPAR